MAISLSDIEYLEKGLASQVYGLSLGQNSPKNAFDCQAVYDQIFDLDARDNTTTKNELIKYFKETYPTVWKQQTL